MSGSDDDHREMHVPELSDEAVEAFLEGRHHVELLGEPNLGELAHHFAVITGGPAPAPDPAVLGRFLAGGDAQDPARALFVPAARARARPMRTALPTNISAAGGIRVPACGPAASGTRPRAGGSARILPFRRRAALGAMAGVAAALAAGSVAVAATTGSLPQPLQRAVVTVIEAITPFEGPADPATVAPRDTPAAAEGVEHPRAPEAGPGEHDGSVPQPSAPAPAGPVTDAPGLGVADQTPGAIGRGTADAARSGRDPAPPAPPAGAGPPGQVGPPAGGAGGPSAAAAGTGGGAGPSPPSASGDVPTGPVTPGPATPAHGGQPAGPADGPSRAPGPPG